MGMDLSIKKLLEREIYVAQSSQILEYNVGSENYDPEEGYYYDLREDYEFVCYSDACFCDDRDPEHLRSYTVEKLENSIRILKTGVYSMPYELSEIEDIREISLSDKGLTGNITKTTLADVLAYWITDIPRKCMRRALKFLRELVGYDVNLVETLYFTENGKLYVVYDSDFKRIREMLGKPSIDVGIFREWDVDEKTLRDVEEEIKKIKLGEDDYVIKQRPIPITFFVVGIGNIRPIVIEKAKAIGKFVIREHNAMVAEPLELLALVQWYRYMDGIWVDWHGRVIPPEVVERERVVEEMAQISKYLDEDDYRWYRKARNGLLKRLVEEYGVEPECEIVERRTWYTVWDCYIPPRHVPIEELPANNHYSIPYYYDGEMVG